jgi:hypothetical protein
MGHTKTPFTWQYSVERKYFSIYRRALQITRDKRLFDRLWGKAEFHIPAAEKTAHPLPIATILISMNLEQEKSIDLLETRLKKQAVRIKKLENLNREKDIKLLSLQKQINELKETLERRLIEQRQELIEIRYSDYDH